MTEKQIERPTNAAKNFGRELKAIAAELSDPDVAEHFISLDETVVKTTAMTIMVADVCGKLQASDKENKTDENGPQA